METSYDVAFPIGSFSSFFRFIFFHFFFSFFFFFHFLPGIRVFVIGVRRIFFSFFGECSGFFSRFFRWFFFPKSASDMYCSSAVKQSRGRRRERVSRFSHSERKRRHRPIVNHGLGVRLQQRERKCTRQNKIKKQNDGCVCVC